MNPLLELAHTHADYVAATASAAAGGHLTVSSTKVIRRSIMHPLKALRRAARGLFFYSLGIGAVWFVLSFVLHSPSA